MKDTYTDTTQEKGDDRKMAHYDKKAQESVEKAVHDYKKGRLRSGSGHRVKNRKQAIAIGLSEAREKGARVPRKK